MEPPIDSTTSELSAAQPPVAPPPTGQQSGGPWPPYPGYGWGNPWAPANSSPWGGMWPPPPVGPMSGPLLKPGFAPGPFFVAVTLAVLGVGVVGSSGFDPGWLAFMSVLIGLNIGLVWIVAFIVAAQDTRLRISRRTWFRWALPPIIFFTAIALMSSGLPTTARFELSRPALGQAAADAQAGRQQAPGWIGLIDVHGIKVAGNTTLFALSSSDVSNGCSLGYFGADSRALDSWLGNSWNQRDYGHGWWYGCQGMPSD